MGTKRKIFIPLVITIILLAGFVFAWIMSFRIRSSRRFFIVITLIPFIVAAVIVFINGNIGAGVAIGGTFGLIRYRSAPGSSDEIASILVAMAGGISAGMGYIAYSVIILVGLSTLFVVFSNLSVFDHKSFTEERKLQITIPESLEYSGTFDEIFKQYLKRFERESVKTTAMGSMFRLSYRIQMKDITQEKEFIDNLRTKNGNLEISITPFDDKTNHL